MAKRGTWLWALAAAAALFWLALALGAQDKGPPFLGALYRWLFNKNPREYVSSNGGTINMDFVDSLDQFTKEWGAVT